MSVSAVHIRSVGAPTGYKIKLPSTMESLLNTASKLVLGGNLTRRVFDRHGDIILNMDVVASGDVLYVSDTGEWRRPPDGTERLGGGRRTDGPSGKLAAKAATKALNRKAKTGSTTLLAESLLAPALRATPVRRSDETPARLCSGRPPYGLMGDPSQLGSKEELASNYSKLRGPAKQQAHVALCVRTARRMQARNLESVGRSPLMFPPGASCAIVGSSGSLMKSRHGAKIDAHDVVMRFNLAPAGGEWGGDVGNRTTIRILTDKVVAPFFNGRSKKQVGRQAEPASSLLLYCMAQGWVGKCMHEHRLGHVNPVFIRHLRAELDQFHGRGRLPSAGITGIAMAISHCRSVSVYGFGNATDAKIVNGTGGHAQQCGHYWDCR